MGELRLRAKGEKEEMDMKRVNEILDIKKKHDSEKEDLKRELIRDFERKMNDFQASCKSEIENVMKRNKETHVVLEKERQVNLDIGIKETQAKRQCNELQRELERVKLEKTELRSALDSCLLSSEQ